MRFADPMACDVVARSTRSLATQPAVPAALPVALSVEPRELVLEPSRRARLQVVAAMRDGHHRDVTDAVEWMTDDAAVACVDGEGKIVAVGTGMTTIRARCAGVDAEISVTVR